MFAKEMANSKKKVKIAIIGGSGDFGRLFAKMLKAEGHEIIITGRNTEKGERVASSLSVEFETDNVSAAKASDVVIVSVPIENTVDVIREVAPAVRPGKLLMDFTSVKVEPVEAMEQYAPENVEVIGMHPMFGPRVSSLEGQTVILTPVRGDKWISFIEEFLSRGKARIFRSTPEEHDRVMAVVQGLTHFAYITTASTIRRIDGDVENSRRFASPVYELMLDFIARIVGQNPRLYASIQIHNPYVGEVHEKFIEAAQELKERVRKKDVDGFIKTMVSAARIFKDVDGSMGKSDKAISAITEELKKLKLSVGKEVALRHIYSRKIHFGKVTYVDPDRVEIEVKGKKTNLKLSNIQLLNEESMGAWKKENMKKKSMDFSYIFPEDVDENVLAQTIKNSGTSIVSCTVTDVFKGEQIPGGKKSITLSVQAIDEKDLDLVKKLLDSLGGIMR